MIMPTNSYKYNYYQTKNCVNHHMYSSKEKTTKEQEAVSNQSTTKKVFED